jgi:hypothetical protein
MAGKQTAALEQKARSLLADMGKPDVTLDEPRIDRPSPARLEIVHPLLAGYPRSERSTQLRAMRSDGTEATVMLELARMTERLRKARIRATADYVLGCIVVSWGRQPEMDINQIRQDLASRSGIEAVSDDSVLIAWAGSPHSEVDALTPALQQAIGAIAPAYRSPGPAQLDSPAPSRPTAPGTASGTSRRGAGASGGRPRRGRAPGA